MHNDWDNSKKVKYVEKILNPKNTPKTLPIQDFWVGFQLQRISETPSRFINNNNKGKAWFAEKKTFAWTISFID